MYGSCVLLVMKHVLWTCLLFGLIITGVSFVFRFYYCSYCDDYCFQILFNQPALLGDTRLGLVQVIWTEPFGIIGVYFHRPDADPVAQPTVSKHWYSYTTFLKLQCIGYPSVCLHSKYESMQMSPVQSFVNDFGARTEDAPRRWSMGTSESKQPLAGLGPQGPSYKRNFRILNIILCSFVHVLPHLETTGECV